MYNVTNDISKSFSLKKEKQRKKKIRKVLNFFKILILTAAFFYLIYYIGSSPLFYIKNAEITGSTKYTEQQLLDTSSVCLGNNGFSYIGGNIADILQLRYKNQEMQVLKSMHYIEEIDIRFRLPDTVVFNIKERTPVFALFNNNKYLFIDSKGFVVDVSENNSELMEIKGVNIININPGQYLDDNIIQDIYLCLNIIDIIKKCDNIVDDGFKLAEHVKYIDISDKTCPILDIDSRIKARIGIVDQEEMAYRVISLKEIFFKKLKKTDRGLIDFTTGKNPIFKPS